MTPCLSGHVVCVCMAKKSPVLRRCRQRVCVCVFVSGVAKYACHHLLLKYHFELSSIHARHVAAQEGWVMDTEREGEESEIRTDKR